jgi:hypothetical protein
MEIIKSFLKKIELLFLWSSGADLQILEQVPIEKNKFLGIGGTIIFTAMMASFAGGYAFFTAFKSIWLSIIFGTFWGALIFNLDRFIVATFGSGDGKKTISKQELFESSPRLLMAILLGFVISTPLELKIFEKEIQVKIGQLKISEKEGLIATDSTFRSTLNKKLQELTKLNSDLSNLTIQKSSLISNSVKFLEERKKELESERNKKKADVQWASNDVEKTRKAIDAERSKSSPNDAELKRLDQKKQNFRSILQREIDARQDVENRIIEFENNRQKAMIEESNRINNEIANLTTQRNSTSAQLADMESTNTNKTANYEEITKEYDGFAAHMEAMDLLLDEKKNLLVVKWLITLLFIFIEIAPILFKMMTERGPYDDIADRIKYELKVRQMELQSNLNQEINISVRTFNEKQEQRLNTELESNKEILLSIAKAQHEIALVAIEKWKEEQKEKIRNGDMHNIAANN